MRKTNIVIPVNAYGIKKIGSMEIIATIVDERVERVRCDLGIVHLIRENVESSGDGKKTITLFSWIYQAHQAISNYE